MTGNELNLSVHRWIAYGFGLGHLPLAPGTFGSVAALILALALESLGGFPLVVAGFTASTIVGFWSIRCLPDKGANDDPRIVIDEIAGQFVAVLPLSAVILHMSADPFELWPGWAMAFVLFRLFDTMKPWPISALDRRRGAAWVMADDLAAGAVAGVVTLLAGWAYHAVLG